VRQKLDHQFLNEIAGFENPTLENMCREIWNILAPELPHLSAVTMIRETCGQKCVYRP
jgi:6-pyruvoyltetrahydropterin/6-carboxytetrahydropterin synthase